MTADQGEGETATFELSNIDQYISTGDRHGYVPVEAEGREEPIGIYEWHLNPQGRVCAAYFTVVPCCESGRCPHWTVVDRWEPLTTRSVLHCPTCGVAGRVENGRWKDL